MLQKENQEIYQDIRAKGGRITKSRKAIVRLLSDSGCLLSGREIAAGLKKAKLRPNRSTLYREFLYLTRNHIIKKETIAGIDYYEIPDGHHHHLICLNCNSIKRVEPRCRLNKEEAKIARDNKFNVLGHSLNFYGHCPNCR